MQGDLKKFEKEPLGFDLERKGEEIAKRGLKVLRKITSDGHLYSSKTHCSTIPMSILMIMLINTQILGFVSMIIEK